jgi:hypothetical protein
MQLAFNQYYLGSTPRRLTGFWIGDFGLAIDDLNLKSKIQNLKSPRPRDAIGRHGSLKTNMMQVRVLSGVSRRWSYGALNSLISCHIPGSTPGSATKHAGVAQLGRAAVL